MRIIKVSDKAVGEMLGKSIYSSSCKLLLSKNTVLKDNHIKSLDKNNINYIYIDDDMSHDIELETYVDESLVMEAVSSLKEIFNDTGFINGHKSASSMIPMDDYNHVEKIVQSMVREVYSNPKMLYNMIELMGTDMYTYTHSVNVAVLSILTAKSLGLDKKTVEKIGIGALLHDIGKSRIDNELINKPGKYSTDEYETMKEHSKHGYDMVRSDTVISPITKQIIYFHHERLDGSGYPEGLQGNQIPVYVRLVTICDMFDAMISDRSYRTKMSVYEALEVLNAESVYNIDPSILSSFIENIAVYTVGSSVQLTDGRVGIVVKNNKAYPTRPVVRIVDLETKKPIEEVDLMTNLTSFIDGEYEI
ncbi:MAG: HD-GYP domain-containing protein [Firmicutes bacterium]|jgi:putative nucleotidyltransferase with HDIG domain|nr:HD-GYP domain-containing protein [Bacillota bacterium]